MNLDFKEIKLAVEKQLSLMTETYDHLFQVDLDKDELWNLYLSSIPEKNNKIFKINREYDCSCCRHFIKSVGNIVAIDNLRLVSIWDVQNLELNPIWQNVCTELSNFVKDHPISTVWLTKERSIGTNYNYQQIDFDHQIKWEHFYFSLPKNSTFLHTDRYTTIDSKLGEYKTTKEVFARSLNEISEDAIDVVLELCKSATLYRGEEWIETLLRFRDLKKRFDKLSNEKEKDLFEWAESLKVGPVVAKIKNHSMGILLVNISEGMDLDLAVTKYEQIVAPTNYKRSKPIYTQRMLDNAKETLTRLGYLSSLKRRFANLDDITVNNVLFSNKDAKSRINGFEDDIFEEMSKKAKSTPKTFSKVEEINIDNFINNVLPTAQEVELYVENKLKKNFVSLIAPQISDSKTMFKWNNNFSWAYTGNLADSTLKKNVEKAGGNVQGVLRFSIQWNDTGEYDGNDLDAHCIEPNHFHIFYQSCKKPKISKLGGQLDIDVITPRLNEPAVENITWQNKDIMQDGEYQFFVHCYTCRGGKSGFRAEIEFDGEIYEYDYNMPLRQGEEIPVANVRLKDGKFSISNKLPSSCSNHEIWGITTNTFVPVSVICYSPNYWDEQVGIGNKHYFFMLKDCVNPEEPNGWMNEYLNNDLYQNHRKVMEALGSRCHVDSVEDQLSGLGFSSTQRADFVIRVKGATERILRIKI